MTKQQAAKDKAAGAKIEAQLKAAQDRVVIDDKGRRKPAPPGRDLYADQ